MEWPSSTTSATAIGAAWQDYKGSEGKSPWGGWQPQQHHEGYPVQCAKAKSQTWNQPHRGDQAITCHQQ
eukprot:7637603-Prorocentrum_lima.AAC.1